MKSFQFFEIYKRFDKKREKNIHTAVNEKIRKIDKLDFVYNILICFAIFAFCYQDDAGENWKQCAVAICNRIAKFCNNCHIL